VAKKQSRRSMQWRTIDLHLHTPASVDYQEPGVTYLEILQRAEARGIDIIAFTDHNTISGYRKMKESVEQLDYGSDTVGATTDVIGAYHAIAEAGGLAIAAHANSTHGVAMRGFTFGGQTRIAYTQDPNLKALEVTDLEKKGRRTTAAFFSGTKPEYPRRMHCIQGSDAHRLVSDSKRKGNLGVGERPTDVLIPEVSFNSLKDLFSSNDFSRTRPHSHKAEPAFDFIQSAREEGSNIVQDFHESVSVGRALIRGDRGYQCFC